MINQLSFKNQRLYKDTTFVKQAKLLNVTAL